MLKVFHSRRFIMLVAMVLLTSTGGLFLGPGKAFACSSVCSSSAHLEYTYSARGMAAEVLDEPISSSACVYPNACKFYAFIYMQDSSNNWAEIGVESDFGTTGCNNNDFGYGEYVFYADSIHPFGKCAATIPTSDRGFTINIQLNDYFSGGGGMQFYANDGGTHTFCTGSTCYYSNDGIQGNSEQYSSYFDVLTFSSNKLTSATVTSFGNMYQNSAGTWTYLTALQHSISAGNPPWIGWKAGQSPNPGNTGGEWYTCAANKGSNPC